ncbi:MAG TPA: hypothetical protein PLY45_01960 [bacterium]|nr:hypothetical protein [bacterium]
MVDKIDRPEAPPAYFITRAKDAKESQHEQKGQRDEEGEQRQKEQAEKDWSKFDRKTTVIKPLRTSREKVARCLFRTVVLHGGVATLQVDVIWKDGHKTDGALVLLARLEDYLKLKKFAKGQEVPEEFWSKQGRVDLGIIQVISSSPQSREIKGTRAEESPADEGKTGSLLEAAGLVEGKSRRVRWGVVAAYAIFAAIAALVAAAALTR